MKLLYYINYIDTCNNEINKELVKVIKIINKQMKNQHFKLYKLNRK